MIVSDPEVMRGTPCFRGTRVPFKNLIDYLEGGHSLGEFLRQFPTVTQDAGLANSSDFPVTNGAFQTTNLGVGYILGGGFLSKLNPTGTALVYSTYLDGVGYGLAVDGTGNAYIAGNTGSPSFPVTAGAFQPASKSCCGPFVSSPFVTKLNPAGSALVYSTYLGGSGICVFSMGPQGYVSDGAAGLSVDSAGNAYVTGDAYSSDFPTTPGAFQAKNKAFHYDGGDVCPEIPGSNAFVTKLNPTGTALVYSTYLGGSGPDGASGVTVDSAGNAYLAGGASSTDFPVTQGAFQTTNRSTPGGNAFVTKMNPAGSGLVYSTYLGGSGRDNATGLAVDGAGNAYATGSTSSTDFPITQGAIQTSNRAAIDQNTNPFLTEVNAEGTALVYSTYLGGSGADRASGLAVDGEGNAYIAGGASSTDFPVTPGAFQTTNHSKNNGSNAFVAKLDLGTPLPAPSIAPGGVVPVYSTVPTIQPGEWVSIYGTNLATSTATLNANYPTSLNGTSVTINGRAGYLWYVSPTQINLQAPNDTATGSVPVVVTTPGGTATATVTLAQFGPSFSLLDDKHVAGIILRSNGSGAYGGGTYDIIGPTGSSLGYPTVAAKAGDNLALFAVGLGPTDPAVLAGQAFSGAAPTTDRVSLLINQASVIPTFAGLTYQGLYQINLTVPAGLGTGDVPLVASVGGVPTPSGVVISLQ